MAGTAAALGLVSGTDILGLIGLPGGTVMFLALFFLFLGCSTTGIDSSSVDNFLSKISGLALDHHLAAGRDFSEDSAYQLQKITCAGGQQTHPSPLPQL